MANTLKFGNGQWYGKKDTILAYNDENNNYKPLPFDFSRDGSATVINKDGLIETVGSGEPRVDYKDDSKGALKLEPSRSNLITYSEDFTQWGSAGTPTVVLSSSLAPNGSLDAYDITDDSTGVYEIKRSNSASFDGTYTMSIFVKKTTGALSHYAGIQFIGLSDYLIIDTTNGTVNQTASEYSNIKVDDFSNWWRISATGTNTGSTFLINLWASISSNGTSLSPFATGTNTFYGVQIEQGSYATSYIPTQGSIGTRVAESCNQTVPSGVIGQTEGVFFLDVGEYKSIGSISSAIIYLYNALGDRLGFAVSNTKLIRVRVNAVNEQIADTQVENSKTAIRYTSTGVDVFYNGVKQTLTIIGNEVFSLPTSVYLYSPNQSFNIKGLQLYNTALTDQELINLTTI